MSSIISGLVGRFFGGRPAKAERAGGASSVTATQSRVSQSTPTAETPKAKAAAKLALIKTGRGGILNEPTTGRRKLLGN